MSSDGSVLSACVCPFDGAWVPRRMVLWQLRLSNASAFPFSGPWSPGSVPFLCFPLAHLGLCLHSVVAVFFPALPFCGLVFFCCPFAAAASLVVLLPCAGPSVRLPLGCDLAFLQFFARVRRLCGASCLHACCLFACLGPGLGHRSLHLCLGRRFSSLWLFLSGGVFRAPPCRAGPVGLRLRPSVVSLLAFCFAPIGSSCLWSSFADHPLEIVALRPLSALVKGVLLWLALVFGFRLVTEVFLSEGVSFPTLLPCPLRFLSRSGSLVLRRCRGGCLLPTELCGALHILGLSSEPPHPPSPSFQPFLCVLPLSITFPTIISYGYSYQRSSLTESQLLAFPVAPVACPSAVDRLGFALSLRLPSRTSLFFLFFCPFALSSSTPPIFDAPSHRTLPRFWRFTRTLLHHSPIKPSPPQAVRRRGVPFFNQSNHFAVRTPAAPKGCLSPHTPAVLPGGPPPLQYIAVHALDF